MVDYFLFELKRGYCDYYASAMVILARAAGIPARLVTGYLSGTFDETTGQYRVTAADAHSWVELYFPSYGWIEFDPTARLSAIERPDAPTAETLRTELETSQNAEAEELEVEGVKPWLGLWIGLLSLISILILWPFIDRWWLHLLAPTDALGLLYRRLHRQARRLNVATQPGDTPYQFAKAFRQQLHLRSNGDQPHGELSTSLDEVDQLIDLFVQSHYSPRQPAAATTREAIRGWQRLRRRLWLARWRK
jgi:hypothetical protein